MRRIFYMIQKEFRQISRDRPMLMIIFVAPLIQMLVLSFAVTTDVKHVKVVIADLDNTPLSREVTRSFLNTDRFDVRSMTTDLPEIERRMREWDAKVGLVIPAGFSADLERGLRPDIGLIMDGVDGNAAGVALGYARGILGEFGASYSLSSPRRVSGRRAPPAAMQERMMYNPDLDVKNYMVPAVVVVLLTMIPMMLSAMSLVKEKEIGTLEQLQVMPLRKHQLLMGKLIPFLILAYIELGIVTTVAVLVFRIDMNGSYMFLAFVSLVYLATTIGLGIFVSTITGTQQQAMFLAWFFMIFMILMSGFVIPVENMPPALQRLTLLNPMKYFVIIVRDIFQKGSGFANLWKGILELALFGIVIFTFGVAKFRKKIA